MPGCLACEPLENLLSPHTCTCALHACIHRQHWAFILQDASCRGIGSAETHTAFIYYMDCVRSSCLHSKCPCPLLARFLAQMKPGGLPSDHRATLLQSLHASGLSARLPFPSGASVPLLKCICPCPLEPGFPIPSSKLGARGSLDWRRATRGFLHGFECLSCCISSQLCHIWSVYNSWAAFS